MPRGADLAPFVPVGSTALIAANFVAPSGVQLVGDTAAPPMTFRQYRVMNNGNQTAFVTFASSAAAAATACVIPTNANVGAASFPLPAGAIEIMTAPVGQYWTGTCAVNTPVSVFISPCIGY
jgi:hypothetical protein